MAAPKKVDLQYKPRDWQTACHLDRSRFRVVVVHRRAGKSIYATMELLDAALKCKKELGLFVYVAPFLSQAKNIAWGMLKHRIKPLIEANAVVINEAELTIEFRHNGAKIKLFGGDNPDGMRGVRLDGAVIDEVAQTKPSLWQHVLQPALSDRLGWVIFVGTPGGIDLFSEIYNKARGGSAGWSAKLFTVYQTNALDPEEVARLKADMSPSSFAREMLCSFDAGGDDQLFSMEKIEKSCGTIYKPGENDYAPRIIGVDPARFGSDASTIIKRQGLQIYDPISFNGMDNMALADQVAYHINAWQPDATFIDAGAGSGVIDRLRQMNHTIIEIPFGSTKVNNPKYYNKKAEMCFAFKDWVDAGGAIPNHFRLKQDMATPIYWVDSAGKYRIEEKAAIKARGLPSTDYLDGAILTFGANVTKKPRESVANVPQKPYDAFDRDRLRNPSGFDPFARGK